MWFRVWVLGFRGNIGFCKGLMRVLLGFQWSSGSGFGLQHRRRP